MKKNIIIAVVSLVVGLVIGYFAGRCCGCCKTEQEPNAEKIADSIKQQVESKLDTLDSVDYHSVRVITTTPENLSQTLDEAINTALQETKKIQAEK